MELSSSAFLTISLFSLLLLADNAAYGRKEPAGEHWKEVTNDQPMPEVIKGLLIHEEDRQPSLPGKQQVDEIVVFEFNNNKNKKKPLNNDMGRGKDESVAKDFELDALIYHGDHDNKEGEHSDCVESKPKKDENKGFVSFSEEFDPIPNISIYHD